MEEGDGSQEQPTLSKDNPFQELIKNKEYEEIVELGKSMTNEELVRQLFPVITTIEHYNGLKEFLKRRKMVSDFYLNGNMEVVEGIIAKNPEYDNRDYIHGGDLETALLSAFGQDHYSTRVMDLFAARQERTAKEDEQSKQQGGWTSFEYFVDYFFDDLAPWEKDTMPLKRFIVNHGEEFSTKYPVVYDTFCQRLVYKLRWKLNKPKAKELMTGLVAQSLITPEAFAEGFLVTMLR